MIVQESRLPRRFAYPCDNSPGFCGDSACDGNQRIRLEVALKGEFINRFGMPGIRQAARGVSGDRNQIDTSILPSGNRT